MKKILLFSAIAFTSVASMAAFSSKKKSTVSIPVKTQPAVVTNEVHLSSPSVYIYSDGEWKAVK